VSKGFHQSLLRSQWRLMILNKKQWFAGVDLRSRKMDEIRELLSIPPDEDDTSRAIEQIEHWLKTGEICVSVELRAKAQQLVSEWYALHEVCVEIQDEYERTRWLS